MKKLLLSIILLSALQSNGQIILDTSGVIPISNLSALHSFVPGVLWHKIDTIPVLIEVVTDFDKPTVKWISGFAVIHSFPVFGYNVNTEEYKTKVYELDKKTEVQNILNWIKKPIKP